MCERIRRLHLTNSWELPSLRTGDKAPNKIALSLQRPGLFWLIKQLLTLHSRCQRWSTQKKTQNKTWRSDNVTRSCLQWPLNSSGQRPISKYSACPCCEWTRATTSDWPLQKKKKNPWDAEPSQCHNPFRSGGGERRPAMTARPALPRGEETPGTSSLIKSIYRNGLLKVSSLSLHPTRPSRRPT